MHAHMHAAMHKRPSTHMHSHTDCHLHYLGSVSAVGVPHTVSGVQCQHMLQRGGVTRGALGKDAM